MVDPVRKRIFKLAQEIIQKAEEIELLSDKVESDDAIHRKIIRKKKRTSTKGSKNIADSLNNILVDGFFENEHTLTEIKEELVKRAILVPLTSLPKYVNKMIRKGKLTRDKMLRGKRAVWIYKKK